MVADKLMGIGQIAGAASSIAGGLLGNTRRQQQYGDQVKLMGIQQGNQMALNKQGAELARENWDYTNYENQVKHMENAGLNVGLMYGGSGPGGTLSSGSGGSAPGGNAPIPENSLGMMGIGLQQMANQNAITQAQVEGIKAKAEHDKAQANEINSKLPEGIKNLQLTNEGITWDNKNKDLDNQLKGSTLEDIIATAGANRNKAIGEAKSALTQGNIDQNTYNQKIEKAGLENALLVAQKHAIDSNIKLNDKQIEMLTKDIEYYEKKYQLDARRIGAQEAYNKNLKQFQDDLIEQGYWKMGVQAVTDVAKTFMNPTGTIINETWSEGMKDKEGGFSKHTTSKTTRK